MPSSLLPLGSLGESRNALPFQSDGLMTENNAALRVVVQSSNRLDSDDGKFFGRGFAEFALTNRKRNLRSCPGGS